MVINKLKRRTSSNGKKDGNVDIKEIKFWSYSINFEDF